MSGPVVAIGFILLIPSILGMLFCGLVLVGVNASSGDEMRTSTVESNRPYQTTFDADFRRSCATSVRQKNQEVGYYASQQLIEQYCECALSAYKQTDSEAMAGQTCLQQAKEGSLAPLGQDADAFYSSNNTSPERQTGAGTNLFRVIGSVTAISLGVAFFVGGLLGWLLVMRKRVLQCSVCGAVVSAS
jgi:hypothetical protein